MRLKKDLFETPMWQKRLIISFFGLLSFFRYRIINKIKVTNWEFLKDLPQKDVLFVSNHQTYFADVAAMINVFSCIKNGKNPNKPSFKAIFNPSTDIYFIAAKETMEKGVFTKILSLAGAIKVHRTWRESGKQIKRDVCQDELENVYKAIKNAWVITFPQGTTTAFSPGRKGTAHIIKNTQACVVPIVVDGFRRAFDKKGLRLKKINTTLNIRFKNPIEINYENDSVEHIMDKIMDSIEQSDKYKYFY